MKSLKHIGAYTLCIFIAFICWSICIANASKIYKFNNSVDLKYSDKQISIAQIKNINSKDLKDNGIMNLAAWHQYNNEYIYSTNKNMAQLNIISVYGDIENIFSSQVLLGSFLSKNDAKGCIIDRQTAYKLWGGTDALGFEVEWDNKIYTVRGILDCSQKIMFTHSDQKREKKEFSFIRLNFANKNNTYEQAQNFILAHNFSDAMIQDIAPIAEIVSQMPILPCALFFMLIVFNLFQVYIKNRDNITASIISVFISLIIIVLFIWLSNFKLQIPSIYIPTRWSNFEFWTRTFEEIKNNYQKLEALPIVSTDLNKTIELVLLSSIGTIGLFILSLKFLKQTNLEISFCYEFFTIISIFAAIIVTNGIDTTVISMRTIWGCWSLFIALNYISHNFQSKLF